MVCLAIEQRVRNGLMQNAGLRHTLLAGEIPKRNNHLLLCIVFEENSVREQSNDYRDTVFEKLNFQNVSRPHCNAKPAF